MSNSTCTTLPKVQLALNDFWGRDPQASVSKIPVTSFLMDSFNRKNIIQQTLHGESDGKPTRKKVELTYIQEQCEIKPDCSDGWCEPADDPTPTTCTSVDFDTVCFSRSVSFGDGCTFLDCMEGGEAWKKQQIDIKIKQIRDGVEKYLTEQLPKFAGLFSTLTTDGATGVDMKQVATEENCGGTCNSLDRTLLRTIKRDAERNKYKCAPTVISPMGKLEDYLDSLGVQCCDNTGFDAQEYLSKYGIAPIITHWADAWADAACPCPFLTLDCGAVQLIQTPCFEANPKENGDLKAYTIVDPQSGLKIDVLERVTCDDKVGFKTEIRMRWNGGLVGMPNDLYCADRYEGLTGVNKYCIVNP